MRRVIRADPEPHDKHGCERDFRNQPEYDEIGVITKNTSTEMTMLIELDSDGMGRVFADAQESPIRPSPYSFSFPGG